MNTTPAEHVVDENCIFCKIISGEIPANKVYEDAYTLAFLDATPVSEGHTLVVPKDHFENIYTTPPETWARTMLTVQKVTEAVRHGINADGMNVYMNNEPAASQIIMHTHIHLIPRHNDDGLKSWHGKAYKSPEEAQSVAEKIKGELAK